jgi:hypothetical protein
MAIFGPRTKIPNPKIHVGINQPYSWTIFSIHLEVWSSQDVALEDLIIKPRNISDAAIKPRNIPSRVFEYPNIQIFFGSAGITKKIIKHPTLTIKP